MASSSNKTDDEFSEKLLTLLREMAPLFIDKISRIYGQRVSRSFQNDIVKLRRHHRRLKKRVRISLALVALLLLWNIFLTYYLFFFKN